MREINKQFKRLCELSDAEYHRAVRPYVETPTTTKGRAERAAILIRKGLCSTRQYDNCFEMSDGDQVMAYLMLEVRKDPDLRYLMQRQGHWSDSYDSVLAPTTDPRQMTMF